MNLLVNQRYAILVCKCTLVVYCELTFFVVKIFSYTKRYENYFSENLLDANISRNILNMQKSQSMTTVYLILYYNSIQDGI